VLVAVLVWVLVFVLAVVVVGLVLVVLALVLVVLALVLVVLVVLVLVARSVGLLVVVVFAVVRPGGMPLLVAAKRPEVVGFLAVLPSAEVVHLLVQPLYLHPFPPPLLLLHP